jgi:DHA1 family tetracycline resistance protein-like MFS transporter
MELQELDTDTNSHGQGTASLLGDTSTRTAAATTGLGGSGGARGDCGTTCGQIKYILPIVALVICTQGTIVTQLPQLRCKFYGASGTYAASAVVGSVGPLLAFLSSASIGALSDRLGRKPFLLASAVSSLLPIAILAVPGMQENFFWVYDVLSALSRMTGSLGFLCLAYASDVVPHEHRGQAFALVGMMVPIGLTAGPLLGTFLPAASGGPSALAIIMIAFLVPYVYFKVPETTGAGLDRQKRAVAAAAAMSATEDAAENPEDDIVLSEFTICDKVLFLFRTDRTVVRDAAIAMCLLQFGFSPVQTQILNYIKVRFGATESVSIAAVFMIGVLGIFSTGVMAPFAQRKLGTRNAALAGFVATFFMLVVIGIAWAVWMVFVGLALCLGYFMGIPLVSAMVSQAAGKKEQGVIAGAYKSMTSIAEGLAPLVFGALFAGTNQNEGCDGSGSSVGQGTWTQGLPWLVAALSVAASCIIMLWRLPLEVGRESAEMDFVPDSATVLEPSLVRRQRQRAQSAMPFVRPTLGELGTRQIRPVSKSVMPSSRSTFASLEKVND